MIEMSSLAGSEFHLGFAGDTLNTAWYARACFPAATWDVSYFTRIGTDRFSAKMKAFLELNNIGTAYIEEDMQRQLGLYLIELQDGERQFTYWRNQSAARQLAGNQVLLQKAFGAADVIYFSAITLAILSPEQRQIFIAQLHAAGDAGKTVVFDTNIRPRLWENTDILRDITMQAAAAAQIILPSFDDETAQFGDLSLEACAVRYRNAGAKIVVVKNGGGAMLIADDNGFRPVADIKMLTPVDTTGAGDAFNGGFLAALLSGQDTDTALKAGHHVAAQVVMQRGALMPMQTIRQAADV
jgi:2-dehydro-3-deoxygluconokinase